MSQDVINIINELQSGELEVRNVPEEFALDLNVVKAERELGLRKSGHRGFDVIMQNFLLKNNGFIKIYQIILFLYYIQQDLIHLNNFIIS